MQEHTASNQEHLEPVTTEVTTPAISERRGFDQCVELEQLGRAPYSMRNDGRAPGYKLPPKVFLIKFYFKSGGSFK
jgi:hypothetical protein